MKLKLLTLAIIISIKVSGQNDTIIFYSNDGAEVSNINDAVSYIKLIKSSKVKFSLQNYYKEKDKWQRKSVTKIKRQSDSSFLLNSEVKTLRIYHKIDSGFTIKDYQDSQLFKEGFSKLIFPLSKSGIWKSSGSVPGSFQGEETYKNNQLVAYKYWISDSSFIQGIWRTIDTLPKFKGGGDPALMDFILNNTKYPAEASRKNIQQRVLVKFIVSSDGHVLGPRVINKVDKSLEKEAIRVVNLMQNSWIPAKSGDINVISFLVLPISFQLLPKPNY